jgi:hypothetical protein
MSIPASEYVTARELYASLGQAETKTQAAIADLKREMLHQFELHETAHTAEDAKRSSRVRWLVGVALTIGGLAGGFLGHVLERMLG